jgi:hypothetical protein
MSPETERILKGIWLDIFKKLEYKPSSASSLPMGQLMRENLQNQEPNVRALLSTTIILIYSSTFSIYHKLIKMAYL